MTAAQHEYLAAKGIDPWSLEWASAVDVGFPEWGQSEAACLPDGTILLANGTTTKRPEAKA